MYVCLQLDHEYIPQSYQLLQQIFGPSSLCSRTCPDAARSLQFLGYRQSHYGKRCAQYKERSQNKLSLTSFWTQRKVHIFFGLVYGLIQVEAVLQSEIGMGMGT